jgi:YidC/Oxa1 family membrane protein insertase
MEFNKRTILWIVFCGSLLMLWNQWMVANGHQSFFSATPPAKTTPAAGAPRSDVPSSAAVPGAPAALPGNASAAVKSETITITTDVMKVDIDSLGGVIKRLELLKYKDGIDPSKNQLLFHTGQNSVYLAQTGLVGGAGLPNHTTPFTVRPGARTLDGGGTLQVVMDAEQNGVRLTKTYTFKRGDYLIDVTHQVTNVGTAPVNPSLYLQLQHDGNKPEGDSFFYSSYTGPQLYTPEEKYQKLDFETIEKKGRADHPEKANAGWIAISQHYFVTAFLPKEGVERRIDTRKVDTNLYAISATMNLGTVAPGASVVSQTRLYAGPQDENRLEEVAPELDRVKDYGAFYPIAKPIFWVMDQIQNVVGNWGWTIIIFTILIKLLFFPLSAAGYKSMAKLRVFTPKMQEIRERYKNDPMKMQQATMELYKKEKINPFGGCLPILVQMPVFIALYYVLQASAEMRGAPWVGWIQDLTAPDPFFILPVLYAVSMYITTKLNPAPPDPMQAKIMLFMPLAFSVMFVFFPSGLVLYWVVNNILSIAQQWVITKKYEDAAKKK